VVCRGPIIQPEHLPEELKPVHQEQPDPDISPVVEALDEESRIKAALRQTDGHQARAAQLMGIDRTTLWRKIKRYGIDVSHYRGR
jgi:transcriptional regulator of acetoin/glycerol metabolism